ncbi:hypothetical protein LTR08_007628 [Meristemomyces frigidus]|nr:hypothetical protein LTR08_007628 [Meristemomyces frigidus]
MDDFFDRTAAEGSEEEEEFDEETGEAGDRPRKSKAKNGDLGDSSDEEDDDDEEEARRIGEGFIVNEDEEDEEERQRKREKRKRRREEKEVEDDQLDEEDLALIGETHPGMDRRQAEQSKYKRLKRGHREDRATSEARGVEDIFSDDDEERVGADGAPTSRARAFGYQGDDMEDFIEQDEFPDEEQGAMDDDLGIRAPKRAGFADLQNLKDSGLDEADLEDMRGAFGDGDEFGWALDAEIEHNEDQVDPDKPLELKDVFEPSQLIEKMLTDDDNKIRMNDVPERFQLARKPYKDIKELSDEQLSERHTEEATFISNALFPRKRMDPRLREPFEAAMKQVLHFMNVDDFEPAFIFQNRKDYLIHSEQVPMSPDPDHPNAPAYKVNAEKLLGQDDLWAVMEQDLKYRAFAERREAIYKSLETLKTMDPDFNDPIFDDHIPAAAQIEDLQDVQDYLNFQYSAQLKDLSIAEAEVNGTQKRARGNKSVWDKVRAGPAYHLVRAFGITADALAHNADRTGRKTYTEDPDKRPDDLADTLVQDPEYRTGEDVLIAAKAMFVEEVVMSPRMRRFFRKVLYGKLVFDVHRTEKGVKQIDEEHPYYEFKYLRNWEAKNFLFERPELFLKMLKAEREGLVEVQVRLQGAKRLKEDLYKSIESDNFSEVADAWNVLRKECIDLAMDKLHRVIARGVKDTIKNECENSVAVLCRKAYTDRLDQAPYRPTGMVLGTIPRVLALSNGAGNRGDAICWAYMEENGRVQENGKFTELRLGNEEKSVPDGKDIAPFIELVERRKPDVIAVSGWSYETRRLYTDLRDIVEKHGLMGAPYEDQEEDRERVDPLDVMIVNDEVARLYHTSPRAEVDHPGVAPLTRYAIALARYMQNPMKEYAALGRDITSISFDSNQQLIPEDKLVRYLETSMVDMVNLVGVDINEAASDPYTANMLPYVCGLGPRKAAQMLKMINLNGGDVVNRADLAGDLDRGIKPSMTPNVWVNAASFIYVDYDSAETAENGGPDAPDYLDNTRIHPEDYDLARKIAADALELDEEDIKMEVEANGGGPSAVVRRLIKTEEQDKVNDLVLEQYAEQLERQMQQRKRATLETIRAELQAPFEELRHNFNYVGSDQIFTMLTGETEETLREGMVVPVSVKRTFPTYVEVKLDCGMEGGISETEYPEEMQRRQLEPRQVWSMHQTIRAKITYVDRKKLAVQLTLRETEMKNPYKRHYDHGLDEWDHDLEARDKKEARKVIDASTGRAQRVIKHPLFRPFNSAQAVEFLGPLSRGDCVVRPSSKGPDHLAVTWKVHEGVYQHIDVLELDKENEFSVGKVLRVGGKWSYSDLDELIVLHVKSMAKKVDEMMGDERYQSGSRQQTEQWLTTYTEANPKRSMYAFCLNAKYPGFFYLCFKAGQNAPLSNWPVKVIPNAFELKGHQYPDMRALKNGFKLLFANAGPGGLPGNGIPRR